MPHLNALYEKYRSQGLEVLTINLGDDDATIDAFWKQNKLSMRVLKSPNPSGVPEQYKVTAIPTNYVVGRDGKILKAFLGYDPDGIQNAVQQGLK